jgi:hypothetical protein
MRNNFLLLLMAMLTLTTVAGATELQRGKIKLVLGEKSGRLTVYYTEDMANPVALALYSAEDPTTSKIKIQLADRVITLGDDSQFVPVYEATAAGGKLTWTSKTLKVTQTFEFLTSAASSVADGVKETLTLTNLTEATSLRPAVRVVLDSNLGEKKDHFKVATGETLNSETKLEGSLPDWWVSPSAVDEKAGFLVMLGKGATVPSRVIFANWKRLDDTPWDFVVKTGRDFNQLPYSYNDSAVAQYYDAQELAPGANREIVLTFGSRTAITFAGAKVGSANVLSDLLQEGRSQETGSLAAANSDLQSLEDVLAQINAKLAEPGKATMEDMKLFKAILEQMEARKAALIKAAPSVAKP